MSDISTPSNAYQTMADRWHLVHALHDGQKAMVAAGTRYLPRFEAETDAAYQTRLTSNFLLNVFQKTVEGAVGKVLTKNVSVNETSQRMLDWLEDAGLDGRDLTGLSRDVFENGMTYGIGHYLIDTTSAPELAGRTATLEDEKAYNIRPYLVPVHPMAVIEQRYGMYRNKPALIRVRIKEDTYVSEGFEEKFVERIRLLEIGRWTLFEKVNEQWVPIDAGTTGKDYIPFTSFQTRRTGPGRALPPLEKLAYANLRHWVSSADQINILKVARVPILHLAGFEQTDEHGKPKPKLVIGPNSSVHSGDTGTVKWIEHSGKAIESGKADLEALEAHMEALSLSLTQRDHSGDVSATEAGSNHVEAHSVLASYALAFRDFLELSLSYMADAGGMGLEGGGTVVVNTDFSTPFDKGAKIQNLAVMRASGDISRETYLREIQATGFFSEDFDVEDELNRVEDEVPDVTGIPMNLGDPAETPEAAPLAAE